MTDVQVSEEMERSFRETLIYTTFQRFRDKYFFVVVERNSLFSKITLIMLFLSIHQQMSTEM